MKTLHDGVPVFADTFDEQLALAGRHLALAEHVFGEPAPTMTITRAGSIYDASLVVIKVIAFTSSQ